MGNNFIFIKLDNLKEMKRVWILLIIALSVSFSAPAQEQPLKIHFLDVGEGDSILIETPQGKTVLIDAGNFISGLSIVEHLEKNNIYNLDYLILTHPHLDHIGGAFFILQMVEVGKVYDNGENLDEMAKSEDIYRWYADLVRKDNKCSVLEAKDTMLLDGVELNILWPQRPFIPSNFNVNSLVIMVKYKTFRCLLAGDLTIPGEEELLKNKSYLEADILKVGHHGCDDASSKGFLKAILPKIAIISVDESNIRGYPSKEVLTRLEEIGTKIYRTDKNGNVVVNIRDNGEMAVKVNK